jgi:hypothetical protein
MRLVSRYSRLLLALSVALCGWNSAQAESFLPESVQMHGFASLGYFNTMDNNFFGDTKQGSGDIDFWELGINGSWHPLPNLQLSMQVVSRKAGETDDGGLRIDYGFLDYSFVSDVDKLLGVRLGRVVYPFGLYGDTRDMPFTRPSILLPQSIYFDKTRQLSLSGDGGQLYGESRTQYGDFFVQVVGSQPRVDDSDLKEDITNSFGGELHGDASWGGRLIYEKDGGAIRFAISAYQLNVDIDPQGRIGPIPRKLKFEPLIFSAQYNAERWSLTGEYASRSTQLQPISSFTGESFYIQGIYRITSQWEAIVRYDVLYWDKDDRDGKDYEAVFGVPAHSRFAKDWTVGVRWDVTPTFMLRAEYHNVDGTGWLSRLDNPQGTKQHWNLFAFLAAYRF